MKYFAKYICLFLAIVGINVNTWAAASVIFPAGSETVNYQDWTTAGAPSSYSNGNYNFTIDAVSYTMHLTSAAEFYYDEASNYLQLRKSDGKLSMRILSKNGCKVTICYARDVTEGSFTMSLGGSEETLNPTTEYTTQMMQTSKKDATLEIATNNSCVAYIKYIKVEAPSRGDISAIAVPEAIVSEVSYDGNGVSLLTGEGQAYEAFPYAQDQSVTTAATPVWTGHTFNGWKRSDNDAIVAAGANFTMPGTDVTLTAQWAVQAYDVTVASVDNATIVANEQAEGSVTSTEYGATVTLDVATDLGYSFDHWNVTKTVGGATVTVTNNQFTMPDAAVTVSAVITKDPVYANYQTYCPRTVQFDKNGQDAATNWPTTITNAKRGSLVSKPAAPSVAGASFIGWFKETTCDNAWDFENDVVGTGDVTTLYAKWEVAKVNVTYHHAGEDHVEPVDYNAQPTGFMPDECAADRVFVGWSESEVAMQDAEPTLVDPTTVSITDEKHFYAVYASKNGGKAGEPTSTTENFNSYGTSSTYDATPIVCGDWTIVNACVSNISDVTSKMGSNAVVIQKAAGAASSYIQTTSKVIGLKGISCYIATTENSVAYQVQYSTNGDVWKDLATSGYHNGIRQKVPVSGTLSECVDAYVRIVLSSAGGTGSSYRVYVDDIELTTQTRSYYLTDYATSCVKAASMTLTYDAQGGTTQTAVTEAGWVTLPTAGECERGCYTLTGWLCSGDELTYEPGAKYLLNHDVTMTAQWSVDGSHALTVKYFTGLEGAPVEGVTVADKYCGSTLTDIPTPVDCNVKDNKEFVGWTALTFADTETQPTLVNLSDPIYDDINLYAVWRIGKSVYRKYTDSPADYSGTYILIDHKDAEHPMALSATLEPIQVEFEDDGTIVTDEHYLTWTVVKTGDTYSLQGINGYLNITADNARAVALSDDAVSNWNIVESSTNGVYNIGLVVGSGQRNVNFNAKRKMWASYKTKSSGYLYKLSGGDEVSLFTMVGACEHVYNAAEISPITSTKDVASRSVKGMVIVENPVNHDNMPYAVIGGANAGLFNVSVTKSARHENSDGSYNYDYVVTYTPDEYDAIHTATITFQDAETKGEYVVASEPITVQGRSLPKEFAIAVKVGDDYIALPGTMGGSTLSPTTIVKAVGGGKYCVEESYRYHLEAVGAESTSHKDDESVWLTSSTGRLWMGATATNMKNVTDAGSNWAGQALTLETEDMVTYLVSCQSYPDNALMYRSGSSKYSNYDQSNVGTSGYYSDIVFLPIAAETGEKMDIVDWNTDGIILNMNGIDASHEVTAAVNGGDPVELTEGSHYSFQGQPDRTYEVATGTLEAGDYLHLATTYHSTSSDYESDRYYKIPYIYTGGEVSTDYKATDEIVIRSGKVTLSGTVAVNKVTIYPGAELVVSGSLTCNEMYIRTTAFQSGAVSGSITVPAGKTYYTRIVADKANYFLFALPLESQLSNDGAGNTTVTATTGDVFKLNKHFRMKTYDAQSRATNGSASSNWENVGQRLTDDKIVARQGYEFLSASAYYREYLFPVTYQNVATGAETALTYYAGENEVDNGWNQICSPYTGVYTQNLSDSPEDAVKFSELNEDNTTYWQHVMTTMWPAQPVFYQAPEAGKLVFGEMVTFAPTVPSSVAARAVSEEPKVATQWLVLNLTNEAGLSDETNFYLHPTKFSADYEARYDLEKMLGYAARPQLYSQMACGNLAFNALPDSVAETRIPLGTYAAAAGEMTFSLSENDYMGRMDHVYLLDEQTGAVTDLMLTDYTYEAEMGTTEGRFFLQCAMKHAPSTPTDIEETNGADGEWNVRKIWYKDHFYILMPDGRLYDAAGRMVR